MAVCRYRMIKLAILIGIAQPFQTGLYAFNNLKLG
jgi:hypothetical protein